MKRNWWLLGISSLAIITAVITWGNGRVQAAPQKTQFVIKTPTLKNCGLAPWLVTDRLGYFAEEGIKMQYTGETQPAMVIPSIIKGNNDVSSSHPNTLATARSGGAKLIGVVRGGIEPPPGKDPKFRHMWFFVNPAKHPNVKTFADLKNVPGKLKIASSSKNICTDFTVNKLADKYGIPRNKFEWISMPDIQGIQALKQKLLDVGTAHPPFFKGNTNAGAIKIADSTETGLGETIGLTYYYFREDFVKRNPRAVAGFVRAIKRGQRWANANPEKTAKWVEEAIGVPVTGNHFYAEDAKIIEAQNAPWIKDLEDHKVIPKGKVTAASLVTHQFEQFGNDDKVYQEKLKKRKKAQRS